MTQFYVPAWLKSSVGADAAFEDLTFDLTFLQYRITYKLFALTIAERAFKELAKLECFLSEEAVVFASFDDYSELTNKKVIFMEKIYKKHLAPRSDEFSQGIPDARAITIDHGTEFHDIIRPESWLLFQLLNVNCSWLGSSSLTWHNFESHRTA